MRLTEQEYTNMEEVFDVDNCLMYQRMRVRMMQRFLGIQLSWSLRYHATTALIQTKLVYSRCCRR